MLFGGFNWRKKQNEKTNSMVLQQGGIQLLLLAYFQPLNVCNVQSIKTLGAVSWLCLWDIGVIPA